MVDNGADGVGAAAARARINTLHADTGKGWAALRAGADVIKTFFTLSLTMPI